ncbi:MAG: cyclase family protein [Clostridia bacterium]|nr:cyclase family protein [Clostridia bacterium]
MKLYDISQEVFGGEVYPGDPVPRREVLCSMAEGAPCNVTAFSMGAHNGTHLDAPFHFLADGLTVEQLPLHCFIGPAFVAELAGEVSAEDAMRVLARAEAAGAEAARRILLKGELVVSLAAAEVFARAGVVLLGNESQSVGPMEAPMAVHQVLLGAGVVLLEGIRLAAVPEGAYLLCAAPLALGGADGAPCRAVLMEGVF